MTHAEAILLGGGGENYGRPQRVLLGQANRHGLVAGATGTGKTVTLQVLAEGFSHAGVPVFAADVKGDLSGIGAPGSAEAKLHPKLLERAARIGLHDFAYRGCPVTFWDLFGTRGHPIRATVSEMGPLLLSRLLGLTEVQEGVLNVAFRVADDEGLLLLDLKDLRALLTFVGENAPALALRYGNVATASVGAIQRALLVLENQGGAAFFGEPALDLGDLMRRDAEGRGRVNILAADRLMAAPRVYATFLLWLLSELFEALPEVGDPEKPVLVFFFDEAHLLFDEAPKALVEKVERVARLIRSKGVSVWFISQNPADVPDSVLGQLGHRVQHGLRAYTPKDRRGLRAAAESFRPNPAFSTEAAILELGTGEAVTSLLDAKGVPGIAERTLIRPPASRIGPLAPEERAALLAASPLAGRYDRAVDRESAFEVLARRAGRAAEAPGAPGAPEREFNAGRRWDPKAPAPRPAPSPGPSQAPRPTARRSDTLGETLAKTVIRSAGSQITGRLVRGVLGGLLRGR